MPNEKENIGLNRASRHVIFSRDLADPGLEPGRVEEKKG
jgi:hypothetical protein